MVQAVTNYKLCEVEGFSYGKSLLTEGYYCKTLVRNMHPHTCPTDIHTPSEVKYIRAKYQICM